MCPLEGTSHQQMENDVIFVYGVVATEYSVSHVRAQLAGAKDGKQRRQRAAAVLYLPSGCVREGIWVGWGDLNAPPSFSEPGEVAADMP